MDARPEERKCLQCGYGLRGLGEDPICPECGTRFGRELVIAGSPRKGGPWSSIITGIVLVLLGSLDVIINQAVGSLGQLLNPCNVVGMLFLVAGLLAIGPTRRHGGNLRWVFSDKGIYVIRGDRSQRSMVRLSGLNRVTAPWTMGVIDRRWRVLKIRRRWHSWDIFRHRTPMLWIRKATRKEILELARTANRRINRTHPELAPDVEAIASEGLVDESERSDQRQGPNSNG